jgi:hypothetical protein
MNYKNIIIALVSFLLFILLIYLLYELYDIEEVIIKFLFVALIIAGLIFIIYKLYFHKLKIEGLENKNKNEEAMIKEENNNDDVKSSNSKDAQLSDYKINDSLKNNEQQYVNTPIASCISACVISYDDCSQSTKNVNGVHQFINEFKCSWSNMFKFSTSNPNDDYNQYCSKCEVIDNVKYIQNNKNTKDIIGTTEFNNDSNNYYEFEFNGKNIQLKKGYYMDQDGNVKKMQKQKAIPSLKRNQELSAYELNMLTGDGDYNNNPNSINNSNSINNNQNINLNQNNSEIQKQIKNHVSTLFDTYIGKLVNSAISQRNVGSNLNTSPHNNIGYINLNSSLNNLLDSNSLSNNRLIQDNPYTGQQICYDAKTGQEIRCPQPYDYKPPMSLN